MTRRLTGAALALGALLAAGCNADELTVPNFNNPTPESVASDPAAIQYAVAGILGQNRSSFGGFVDQVGRFGRESYDYFPTDARNVSHYFAQSPIDPAGFAQPGWTFRYRNLRNLFNLGESVEASTTLTEAQKQAARGFIGTIYALELHYVIAQVHNAGAPVEVTSDPAEVQPFVSRDSVYNYIVGRLNESYAQLQAGGASFPFRLHAGFTTAGDFSDPAGFAEFNRALAARVEVWRASLGNPACGASGATCYTSALAALDASFLDPSADLYTGVYHIFSAEGGDLQNPLNNVVDPDLLAHPSIIADAPTKADGTKDNRYVAKIRTLSSPRGQTGGIPTPIGFQIYETNTSPAPIIRNEELILLRAEALYFTGDVAGALADVNLIRTTSGGLEPIGASAIDTRDEFITELLAQRRLSLLWEGHRWVDVRRFGRLLTLPKDLPTHFIHEQQPIPQAECVFRATLEEALRCPPVEAIAVG